MYHFITSSSEKKCSGNGKKGLPLAETLQQQLRHTCACRKWLTATEGVFAEQRPPVQQLEFAPHMPHILNPCTWVMRKSVGRERMLANSSADFVLPAPVPHDARTQPQVHAPRPSITKERPWRGSSARGNAKQCFAEPTTAGVRACQSVSFHQGRHVAAA